MKTLRDYQMRTVEKHWLQPFFALIVDCGLGKTVMAIVIALKKKLPTIIITPKHLCEQWKLELMEEGVDEEDIFIYERKEHTKKKDAYIKGFVTWLQK